MQGLNNNIANDIKSINKANNNSGIIKLSVETKCFKDTFEYTNGKKNISKPNASNTCCVNKADTSCVPPE